MSRARRALHLALILVAGLVAYANSYRGVFLFDDPFHITPARLAERVGIADCLSSTRGIVQCSLVLDYARGGMYAAPYHLTNVLVHLAVALVLYAVLARVLAKAAIARAESLAAMCALLWVVHPLNTESVTYVIQRAESLVSLFYLVTLYAALRRMEGHRAWSVLAIASCFLGVCTKPVMVTAPIAVLLLDRTLYAQRFVAALRARPLLYAGLLASWAWLFHLLGDGSQLVTKSHAAAGFVGAGVTPLEYLLNQGGVILLYLKLVLVPYPLCLDYGRATATGIALYAPALVVLGMVLFGLVLLRRGSAAGLLVTGFFLVLAPSSSLLPIHDLAAEHRMYLPLALALLGLILLAARRTSERALWIGSVAIACVLAGLTCARNRDYHSALAMYAQMVEVAPDNDRAHAGRGALLLNAGRTDEAIVEYRRALALRPSNVEAASYLASTLLERGDRKGARATLEAGLRADPRAHTLHLGLAAIDAREGDLGSVRAHLERAIELYPEGAVAHANLGRLLLEQHDLVAAIAHLERAAQLDPSDATVRADLARARGAAP